MLLVLSSGQLFFLMSIPSDFDGLFLSFQLCPPSPLWRPVYVKYIDGLLGIDNFSIVSGSVKSVVSLGRLPNFCTVVFLDSLGRWNMFYTAVVLPVQYISALSCTVTIATATAMLLYICIYQEINLLYGMYNVYKKQSLQGSHTHTTNNLTSDSVVP